MSSLFKIFRKSSVSPKVIKEQDFILVDEPQDLEAMAYGLTTYLIDESLEDRFHKVFVSSTGLVEFIAKIFLYENDSYGLLERQKNGLINALIFKPHQNFNPQFFNLFENWDSLIIENDIPLDVQFVLLKKLVPAFVSEAEKLLKTKDHEKIIKVISSPGFSSLCLSIDDILSPYGYSKAYHDKEFRDSFGGFLSLLDYNHVLGKQFFAPQAVHYLSLKSLIFGKDYNFLSEVGIGKDDAYTKHNGVTYALQSDLYKFSNLVFFSVSDLESMYMYASNYFSSDSLAVTTKVHKDRTHEGQMRIIDERRSFIFNYEKIRGHMNFPDVFTSIMKNSYVAALNGVITTQVEYKMRVADSINQKHLNKSNTLIVPPGDLPEEEVRLDEFLKFVMKELNLDYEQEIKTNDFKAFRSDALLGLLPDKNEININPWVKFIRAKIRSHKSSRVLSNLLRYSVFTNNELKVCRVIIASFLYEVKEFDSDLLVFEDMSFDVRKSREKNMRCLLEFNNGWANDPEVYLYEYMFYEIKKNKVFQDDDFICSFVMDSLFKKWASHQENKRDEEAYKIAIMIKDLYALVILNSSTEYENDFWEKYSVDVDRIYHEYVYEKDTGGTELVLINNFDLRVFWINRENKQVSIKAMWDALEKFQNSLGLFEKVFAGKKLYMKSDSVLRRGPALNDTYSVVMEHDASLESLFNRLIPRWFKHCLESDDLSFEKLKEVIDSGKKAVVSRS